MAKEKNSFIIYYDFEDQTSDFTDQQVGSLVRAVLAYEKRGELPERAEPAVRMAFLFLKPGLDSNREKYDRICERNRRNRVVSSPMVTTGTTGTTGTSGTCRTDTEPESDPEPDVIRRETLINDFYTGQPGDQWPLSGTRGR